MQMQVITTATFPTANALLKPRRLCRDRGHNATGQTGKLTPEGLRPEPEAQWEGKVRRRVLSFSGHGGSGQVVTPRLPLRSTLVHLSQLGTRGGSPSCRRAEPSRLRAPDANFHI